MLRPHFYTIGLLVSIFAFSPVFGMEQQQQQIEDEMKRNQSQPEVAVDLEQEIMNTDISEITKDFLTQNGVTARSLENVDWVQLATTVANNYKDIHSQINQTSAPPTSSTNNTPALQLNQQQTAQLLTVLLNQKTDQYDTNSVRRTQKEITGSIAGIMGIL